jgi:hypothetical protein
MAGSGYQPVIRMTHPGICSAASEAPGTCRSLKPHTGSGGQEPPLNEKWLLRHFARENHVNSRVRRGLPVRNYCRDHWQPYNPMVSLLFISESLL